MTRPLLADLPDVIPVFPLPSVLLLPRARLPLHIFEPRYLAMVEDCLKTPQRLIGMLIPHGAGLAPIGCAGRISQFAEAEDDRYMITLTGVCRFAVKEEVPGFTPYRRAQVDWRPFAHDLEASAEDAGFDKEKLLALVKRFFAMRNLAADWSGLEDAPAEVLINAFSMLSPLSGEDRQALLAAPDLSTRCNVLTTLIEFALYGGASDEVMQ